jgi:hypothetical protein
VLIIYVTITTETTVFYRSKIMNTNNQPLEFRQLPNNELSLKIKGKKGLQSIYSSNNFQSGIRGLTYESIIDLPSAPSLPLIQTELSIVNNCDKNMFFPKKKLSGYYKGMNPNEYEYVWGVKYKGYDNDNYWYKACFLNILDNKFAFITSTDKFLDHTGLIESLSEGWYVCRNGVIAPALFWSCVIDIIKYKYIKLDKCLDERAN